MTLLSHNARAPAGGRARAPAGGRARPPASGRALTLPQPACPRSPLPLLRRRPTARRRISCAGLPTPSYCQLDITGIRSVLPSPSGILSPPYLVRPLRRHCDVAAEGPEPPSGAYFFCTSGAKKHQNRYYYYITYIYYTVYIYYAYYTDYINYFAGSCRSRNRQSRLVGKERSHCSEYRWIG